MKVFDWVGVLRLFRLGGSFTRSLVGVLELVT